MSMYIIYVYYLCILSMYIIYGQISVKRVYEHMLVNVDSNTPQSLFSLCQLTLWIDGLS